MYPRRLETSCIHSAFKLFQQHHGGEIFCVTSYEENGDVRSVQNFFVPPQAKSEDFALNADDQNYHNCPKLTVAEVRSQGLKIDPFAIKNR
jgi:hypothetical protein